MSVVANVSWAVKLVILEIADQVKMRLISLLIKGFSRVFQILLKYLNGTAISTSSEFEYHQQGFFLIF